LRYQLSTKRENLKNNDGVGTLKNLTFDVKDVCDEESASLRVKLRQPADAQ
jgi:hypothetical protein